YRSLPNELKDQCLGALKRVLPEHTAPAAFLKARDSYFSFYPMFAVHPKYVIKNARGEPSEAYWLGMMRDWLMSIQNQTDQVIARGQIDVATASIRHSNSTKISDAALTGFKLLCSHGEKYECMG
ncbi:hypothetical protein PRIPAC_96575, partial [Pristionchus pacificus]|uniref:Uncharacterized protein n=1 Tax=Pristionchus pacificus TaxID=54126 RepID=A0A2A6D201_PRIPA